MIGLLRGRVVSEEATGGLVLDVGGVGYELLCPIGTVARAATVDAVITIYVHTNLRQDALELFGFASLTERSAFRQLTHVPNVGPKLALSVLNVLPAAELAAVIDAEDKARLSKVPGVGKKTAERLVLELRGKLPRSSAHDPRASINSTPERSNELGARLTAALTGLGYRPAEGERAAKAMFESHPDERDLSTLLRKALEYLST